MFYFLAIIPWTFIVSLMTFYFKAGQVLGHAPSPNNPDPKELDICKIYSPFVDWTADIWLYSFFLWLLLTIAFIIVNRKKMYWTPLVVSGVGQFFGILLLLSGIFEWYID